jgi:putative phage-type endonuclease
MIERKSDQGSQEWLKERAGHATASCFSDIVAFSKKDGAPLKARQDYLMKLVCERITGEPEPAMSSYAMNWGTDAEPFARKEYELQTGAIVQEIGFRKHPDFEWVGASSDGLVVKDGAIEIKCPYNSTVHLNTIENGTPEAHMPQIQGQIWVLGLEWVDFISYDPRMPPALKIYIQRINRNQQYIDLLKHEVLKFLDEVQSKVDSFLKIAA